jgi:hypothetical protein
MYDLRVTRAIEPNGREWSASNQNAYGGNDPAVVDRFDFDGQDIVCCTSTAQGC